MGSTYQSASPCVGVCVIDASTGHCYGCFRTLSEIARWGDYDDAQRERVRRELDVRRQAAGVPSPATRV